MLLDGSFHCHSFSDPLGRSRWAGYLGLGFYCSFRSHYWLPVQFTHASSELMTTSLPLVGSSVCRVLLVFVILSQVVWCLVALWLYTISRNIGPHVVHTPNLIAHVYTHAYAQHPNDGHLSHKYAYIHTLTDRRTAQNSAVVSRHLHSLCVTKVYTHTHTATALNTSHHTHPHHITQTQHNTGGAFQSGAFAPSGKQTHEGNVNDDDVGAAICCRCQQRTALSLQPVRSTSNIRRHPRDPFCCRAWCALLNAVPFTTAQLCDCISWRLLVEWANAAERRANTSKASGGGSAADGVVLWRSTEYNAGGKAMHKSTSQSCIGKTCLRWKQSFFFFYFLLEMV